MMALPLRSLAQRLPKGLKPRFYHPIIQPDGEKPPKNAPPCTGYNYILHRVANIVLGFSERQPTILLHVYPENNLLTYFGDHGHFDVRGYSDRAPDFRKFSEEGKYKSIKYETSFEDITKLPHRTGVYGSIVNCMPVYIDVPYDGSKAPTVKLSAPPVLAIEDFPRILSSRGILVLGYPEVLWNNAQIHAQLRDMHDEGDIQLLAAFGIDIALEHLEQLPAHKVGEYRSFDAPTAPMTFAEDDKGNKLLGMKYMMAVARRR